ncbi:hypothetical protein DSCA_22480 [Desulfosarcina alkanivorans]|uniref:GP-PDE domain-containing protein n=1 Tax=Desulfosarcina alkanivorans TaxID=571177 RepID=A0A5K7YH01_9BACT|nr:glycerophosphodiester phosphodiesterase family protein [Desulfosarcina alkanivorans]BBO68318.1 hypothetical protein DSCA_22480 [Desulfosarcina alkanivorans]
MEDQVEALVHRLVGRFFRRWPRPAPPPHLLRACRIVSHRGEHDNRGRIENTLAAFDAAADAGVWGLEMDVRWTRDLVPVVFHDPDTRRLFMAAAEIGRTPMDALRKKFPLIPSLGDVVDRYGGRRHLMMELKAEPYPAPDIQARRLKRLLRHLEPGTDFHLMGLHPGMFAMFAFLPPRAFLPIARIRIDPLSRMAAACGWGGITGHFLPMTRRRLTRHHELGQGVGTGFVDSRRCLYREAWRGVDWIFSNRAVKMQGVCVPRSEV